ncbi:MAG TPA: beta-L-arabinofuranosidase domain-containing protein [Candidatus Saccharimonadales bacterium]|nr:beta-L-arabinofuranosidase domain-containing protein [Candidatus Saccharimonadales bacterium]
MTKCRSSAPPGVQTTHKNGGAGALARAVLSRLPALAALTALALVAPARAEAPAATSATPYEKVSGQIALAVRAFEPSDVRLLDGPFKKAFDDNTKYLLSIDPDRLLHRFRVYAGLPPKGDVYGGWESMGLSGHTLGHYLSACALAYAASGDARLLERVNYIVGELERVQKARGDGYIGAIPDQDTLIRDIERGDFFDVHQNYFNGFWAPWYTIHKIFAGLLDAHRCAGNDKALDLATRFGQWAVRTTRNLDHAAWQKMLYAEFGGMSEVLDELYARTGSREFLDLAHRFYHEEVLDPLAAGEDKLDGYHANCQIPKIIGAARDYELTGDEKMRRVATFFWETVVHEHTYANGGNSEGEYFGPPGKIAGKLTSSTSETCNTYNMLKLTRHLFTWEPKAEYADYTERALFNHILASIEPGTAMKCYYMPLAGQPKEYSTPYDSFWCCVGTGMENPPRYTDSIYFHDEDTLYVNLFAASRVEWREKGVTISQETRFPEEEVTRLKVVGSPARFSLKIRRPHWAAAPVTVTLNGKPLKAGGTGPYISIDRQWKDGDLVEVRLPMGIRLEATPDDPDTVALFYGPILLAADLGPEGKPAAPTPVLLGDNRTLVSHVLPASGEDSLRFRTSGIARPNDVGLLPYYEVHHDYDPVYFERITEDEWARRERERKETEERTLDRIEAGDDASGAAHALDTAGAPVEMPMGRPAWSLQDAPYAYVHFRLDSGGAHDPAHEEEEEDREEDPDRGPGEARGNLELRLEVWSGREGSLDLTVNGIRVAKADVKREKPLRLEELAYPLPRNVTEVPGKLDIWIMGQRGKPGPALFGAALLRSAPAP